MSLRASRHLADLESLALGVGEACDIVRENRYKQIDRITQRTRRLWEALNHPRPAHLGHVARWIETHLPDSAVWQALQLLMERVPVAPRQAERTDQTLERLFMQASADGEFDDYYALFPQVSDWCRQFAAQVVHPQHVDVPSGRDAAWRCLEALTLLNYALLYARQSQEPRGSGSVISIANGFCTRVLNGAAIGCAQGFESTGGTKLDVFVEEIEKAERANIKLYTINNAQLKQHIRVVADTREHFANVRLHRQSVMKMRERLAALGEDEPQPSQGAVPPFHGRQIAYISVHGDVATAYYEDEQFHRLRLLIQPDDADDRARMEFDTQAGAFNLQGNHRYYVSVDQPESLITSAANQFAPVRLEDLSSEAEQKGHRAIRSIMGSFRQAISGVIRHSSDVLAQWRHSSGPLIFVDQPQSTLLLGTDDSIESLRNGFLAGGTELPYIESEETFAAAVRAAHLEADFPVSGVILRQPVVVQKEEAEPEDRRESGDGISRLVHDAGGLKYPRLSAALRHIECYEVTADGSHHAWVNPESQEKVTLRHSDTQHLGETLPTSHVINLIRDLRLTTEQLKKLSEFLR